jgi:GH15 family glucan-1,4-alpha-glucosidase
LQHAIGEHALLADGRTAALVDPDGNIAWLCWPRVDSSPVLFSLLDDTQGGCFSLRPAAPATVASRSYHDAGLVLRTEWRVDQETNVVVDDALAWDGPAALIRRVRTAGPACFMEVRFRPAFDAGRQPAEWRSDATRVTASGGGLSLAVDAPGEWRVEDGTAVARFELAAGEDRTVVLGAAEVPATEFAGIDETIAHWQRLLAPSRDVQCGSLATDVMGAGECARLMITSVAVLLGLLQRGGGVVAAPTTSLPQWPGSSRTWDYRYCWLRDASLAGIALARTGQVHAAHALAAFLAEVINEHGPTPVFRVDGQKPPAEHELRQLQGYRGAKPVRIGNAAAAQVQIDAPAEFIELAWTLTAHGGLPAGVGAATSRCADWLVANWGEPDHGIWEIRGRPRQYTHSRMVAAVALNGASRMAGPGILSGDGDRWRRTGEGLRAEILAGAGSALELRSDGGGADAALALMSHVGFLAPHDPLQRRTLDLIERRLDRNGLLDRYEGQPDEMRDPCGPFVFPTFWMATALQSAGGDGSPHFRAAVGARGSLGLFGEVVDPHDGTPLGNYPQLQSHAAFLNAATEAG